MKRKLLCFFLIAIFISVFSIPEAFAATPSGRKLDKNKQMVYFVHEGFSTETFNAVNHSMYKWQQATGYSLMKRDPNVRHAQTDVEKSSRRDGYNLIYRVGVGRTGYVAINYTRWDSNNIIYESDINMNVSYSFANSAQPGCYDAYSVILHELGHTVGLSDITSPTSAVMYESASLNATKRNLTSDDSNGASAIYQ